MGIKKVYKIKKIEYYTNILQYINYKILFLKKPKENK